MRTVYYSNSGSITIRTKKKINDEMAWRIFANVVMIFFCVLVLVPFALLVIGSVTDNKWANINGFSFFPKAWSIDAYAYIVSKWNTIGHGYLMTIVVTVVGTFLSIVMTSMYAYGLSDKDLPGGKLLNFLTVFTMLFSGGIVASFYCWTSIFQIRDTIWALILPGYLMNAFNIILVKNYYTNSIPKELIEAAKIDGAAELNAFWKVVFPLSKPIIATIGIMSALMYWNDWQNGLYYLTARGGSRYYTVQIILNNINENLNFLMQNATQMGAVNMADLPTTTVRMAIAIVGVLPIMVIYPFCQKYFVKGITLGGVKG